MTTSSSGDQGVGRRTAPARSSLQEALSALDNLTRLSAHLWNDVDVPLRLVEAMRSDLAHLELHLRRVAGLQAVPKAPREQR